MLIGEFLAPFSTGMFHEDYPYAPPQRVHVISQTNGGIDLGLYVYGYRQVLPMQLLMLVFDGALLARLVGQLGQRRRRRSEAEAQPLVEQRPA